MAARRAVCLALAAAVVFSISAVALAGGQRSGAATKLTVYSPFGPGGLRPEIVVTRTVTGYCNRPSKVAPHRADASRCSFKYGLERRGFDPCFADLAGDRRYAICPVGTVAVRVRLTRPFSGGDGDAQARKGLPWVMKLANAKFCLLLTGTPALFHGRFAYYICPPGHTPLKVLVGRPDRSQPRWTILYAPDIAGDVLVRVGIVEAAW